MKQSKVKLHNKLHPDKLVKENVKNLTLREGNIVVFYEIMFRGCVFFNNNALINPAC